MNRILIVGAGRRVQEDVLPVLESIPETFDSLSFVATKSRQLIGRCRTYEVLPIFHIRNFKDFDYIYIAVPPSALRSVLKHLNTAQSNAELIVDTPADISWSTLSMIRRFRRVHVAEDVVMLPWIDTLHNFWRSNNLSGMVSVEFDRSAYFYHGVALAKVICGSFDSPGNVIKSGRRGSTLSIQLDRGRVVMNEPRDYEKGIIRLSRGGVVISSHVEPESITLQIIRNDKLCRGFQIDSVKSELSLAESKLIGNVEDEDTIVSRMLDIKRVGLLKMMIQIASGKSPWSLEQGQDDFRVAAVSPGRFGRLSWFIESIRRFR